ncbi:hypothetical protein GCM10022408_19850 [Hymenobacter fastidiosus]|uniref:Hemopexin n=1 Tax=Hymenobacter fastidiosus TaxID=486264 RepID=A0ABP7S8B2_9BACT
MKSALLLLLLAFLGLRATGQARVQPAAPISDAALQRVLRKAISMQGVCSDRYAEATRTQDIAAVNTTGARFIGRAAYWWNTTYGDAEEQAHFRRSYRNTRALLSGPVPERIVQAGVFEFIAGRETDPTKSTYGGPTTFNADVITIPKWVLQAWGQPTAVRRTFSAADIAYRRSDPNDPTATDKEQPFLVPDVTRLQARMWLYYRACSYLAADMEALHMGQWNTMAVNDARGLDEGGAAVHPPYYYTRELFRKIRDFAAHGTPGFPQLNQRRGARRGFVVLDCHSRRPILFRAGASGVATDLFDFYSSPISAEGILTGGTPSFYGAPVFGTQLIRNQCSSEFNSGLGSPDNPRLWLVELDNSLSDPAAPNPAAHKRMWGWDEISWFAAQPRAYRADWLRYVHGWLQCNAPAVRLQMPGRRKLSGAQSGYYRFNAPGNPEVQRIKALWSPAPATYFPAGPVRAHHPSSPVNTAASNLAVEADGSLFWVDAGSGLIRYARWDAAAAPPQWKLGTIPDVTNAAGDLLFLRAGLLFYRTTDHKVAYCEYQAAPKSWRPRVTDSATSAVPANVGGDLVFESSGWLQQRTNTPTVFYRSTRGQLDYVQQQPDGTWAHATLNVAVDSAAGAIACPAPGTVAYVANHQLKVLRLVGGAWEPVPGVVRDAVGSLAVEQTNPDSEDVVFYYHTQAGSIGSARYNYGAATPGWGAHTVVTGTEGARGPIIVTGSSALLYQRGHHIRSARWCPAPEPAAAGWVGEQYGAVQNCGGGLVRQADNSLYYLGLHGEVRYLTWEAIRD